MSIACCKLGTDWEHKSIGGPLLQMRKRDSEVPLSSVYEWQGQDLLYKEGSSCVLNLLDLWVGLCRLNLIRGALSVN